MISKKNLKICFVFLFSLSILLMPSTISSSEIKKILPYEVQRDFNLFIEFIGFDSDFVLEENIEYILPLQVEPCTYLSPGFPQSSYSLNYSFSFATEQETEDLVDFLDSIAIEENNIGYRGNTTLIEEYIEGENITDIGEILLPYNGTRMSALEVEEYLYENFYSVEQSQLGYTLYIMNFSRFDSLDHSIEHTYFIEGIEFDSEREIEIIFAESDTKEYMPVAGWGGKYRFSFIDVSASLDYLFLLPLIFEGTFNGYYNFDYYKYDLDAYVETQDLSSSVGKANLAIYLSDWIYSYIYNIYFPFAFLDLTIFDGFSIPIKVISNVTSDGYSLDDISWMISPDKIEPILNGAFPWIDWSINVEFMELDDDPNLYSIMQNSIEYDESGYYIDVQTSLLDYIDSRIDTDFNLEEANSVLPYYIFVSDDVEFRFGSIVFHEFGTPTYVMLIRSPQDLFIEADVNRPFYGSSTDILLRLGYMLGLTSPHNNYYGWGADYVSDVMNFLSRDLCGTGNFSAFSRDEVARIYYDFYSITAKNEYELLLEAYNNVGPFVGAGKYINNIPELLLESEEPYNVMDYFTAIEKAKEAYTLMLDFTSFLESPSGFLKPGIFYTVVIGGSLIVIAIPSSILISKGNIKSRKL